MKNTIMKWFDRLNLPNEWRDEVEKCAETFDPYPIAAQKEPYRYLSTLDDKMTGLLYALHCCDECEAEYIRRGIPEDIMLDTLDDIKIHAENYNIMTGYKKIGIEVIEWIGLSLEHHIYKLGRLQFEFTTAFYDDDEYGIKKGEDAIAIHIRRGAPLLPSECEKSYSMLEDFLKKYYPWFDFKCFTADTWLLDSNMHKFLKPTSNIRKVFSEYKVVKEIKSFSGLKFLFDFSTDEKNVVNYEATNPLQEKVKEYVTGGGQMYCNYGYRLRQK